MAAASVAAPQRGTKRRRTRKAKQRTNAASSFSDSSSSDSDSSDSDADSEEDQSDPVPAQRTAPSSDSSSSESDTDSSSDDSDSDSSDDSSSSEQPAAPTRSRVPLPNQDVALAAYTASQGAHPYKSKPRVPSTAPEDNRPEGEPQFPSRKEEKRAERHRQQKEREERRAHMKRYTPSPLPSDEDTEDEALDSLARHSQDGSTDYARARNARMERSRQRAERVLGQTIPDPVWAATSGDAMAAALQPKKLGLPPLPSPAQESKDRVAAHLALLKEQREQLATESSAGAGTTNWDHLLGQATQIDNVPAQDTLADIWMRSVADHFGEELNAIREVRFCLSLSPLFLLRGSYADFTHSPARYGSGI